VLVSFGNLSPQKCRPSFAPERIRSYSYLGIVNTKYWVLMVLSFRIFDIKNLAIINPIKLETTTYSDF